MGARRGVEQAPLRYQLVLVLRKAAPISGHRAMCPFFAPVFLRKMCLFCRYYRNSRVLDKHFRGIFTNFKNFKKPLDKRLMA